MLKKSAISLLAAMSASSLAFAGSVSVLDTSSAERIHAEIQSLGSALGAFDDPQPQPAPQPGPGPQPVPQPVPQPKPPHDSACERVHPDDAQKAKLREVMHQHEKIRVAIEAEMKTAHMEYGYVVTSPNSSVSDAQVAGQAIVQAVSKVAVEGTRFSNSILFDVFRPEQRADAFHCMMEMRHRQGRDHF